MSTPRRDWPRSMGTPMMRIFCGIAVYRHCDLRLAARAEWAAEENQSPLTSHLRLVKRAFRVSGLEEGFTRSKDTPGKSCGGRAA